MRFSTLGSASFLIASLLASTYARYVPDTQTYGLVVRGDGDGGEDSEVDCRPKCGAPKSTLAQRSFPRELTVLRSLPELCDIKDSSCSTGLEKRVLDELSGKKATSDYIVARTDAVERNNGGIMFRDDASTSKIAALGANSFDFGMSGLCGCTLLLIVSETHVMGFHFYETLAFDDTVKEGDENTADFQGNCLNFLQGSNANAHTEGPSLFQNRNNFPAGETKAYIMSPEYRKKKLYGPQVDQIVARVNSIIGVSPTKLWYVPVDSKVDESRPRPLLDTERGRALYQYDVDNGVRSHRFLFQLDEQFSEIIQ